MRGKHISRPVNEIIDEAKQMASQGIKELILIAQELTYYGIDLYKERTLAKLLKDLCKIDGIEWIRLHYAYPSGFPDEIIDVIKNEDKICNYLDIPIQHISDKILKSMRRGAGKEKINNLIKKIRVKNPNIAIRTTLIVGYPGENKDDFNELCSWIKEMKFDRLGCFTYSHEENTHAYNLEDIISEDEKKLRQKIVMQIQSEISSQLNKEKLGKKLKCIIDRYHEGYYIGRSEYDSPDVDNNILIKSNDNHLRIGDFYDVIIKDSSKYDLIAELL
jgi:ribosomal protein S12 methylthiotransferase